MPLSFNSVENTTIRVYELHTHTFNNPSVSIIQNLSLIYLHFYAPFPRKGPRTGGLGCCGTWAKGLLDVEVMLMWYWWWLSVCVWRWLTAAITKLYVRRDQPGRTPYGRFGEGVRVKAGGGGIRQDRGIERKKDPEQSWMDAWGVHSTVTQWL